MVRGLECSTPDRVVRVWVLVLGKTLNSHGPAEMLGVTHRRTSIPSSGGEEILLVASCYGNWR